MNDSETIPELEGFPVRRTLPVLWGNMDAFGHVNNTVPIRWFECGRIALLEEAGLSEMMAGGPLGPILAAVHCNYRRQIRYPDEVIVASRVGQIGRSSMHIEHRIYSRQNKAVACEGESVVVVFDYQTQRPVRIPDSLHKALENFTS